MKEDSLKHGAFGKILRPPADIPNIGRFCVLGDPQGGTICTITYAEWKQAPGST